MKIVWVSPNKHYQVIMLPRVYAGDGENAIGNYGVQNISTEAIESTSHQLPIAIASAAQFDYMLENDTWKDWVRSTLGLPGEEPLDIVIGGDETLN